MRCSALRLSLKLKLDLEVSTPLTDRLWLQGQALEYKSVVCSQRNEPAL